MSGPGRDLWWLGSLLMVASAVLTCGTLWWLLVHGAH